MNNKKYKASLIALSIIFIILIIALIYISGISISIKTQNNKTENYTNPQDITYRETYSAINKNLTAIASQSNASLMNFSQHNFFSEITIKYMLLIPKSQSMASIINLFNQTVNYLAHQGISNETIVFYNYLQNPLYAVSLIGKIYSKNYIINVDRIKMNNITIRAQDLRNPQQVLNDDMPLVGCNNAIFSDRTITFNCTDYPYVMNNQTLNSAIDDLKIIGYIATGAKNFTMKLYYTSKGLTKSIKKTYPDNISFFVPPEFTYDKLNNIKMIIYSKNKFN